MRHHLSFGLLLLAITATRLPVRAQDPTREIQDIARAIEEQLQEIDRLLLESGKAGQARSQPKQMLEQASERSTTVQDGIDKLIEKLNEMKNQSGSGQGEGEQPSPQQGQGQQQPQQSPQNRRENQTPDFVPQPQDAEQPQPGGQKPAGQGQPQGGQQAQDQPDNRRGNQPPEGELGPGQRGDGESSWGELQPYVNFLKNRGSAPKVPEKYRKYWEAYLKNKQGSGGR